MHSKDLEYFLAIEQLGTISAAARKCHVSQPTISMAVSRLERELEVDLLVHTTAAHITMTKA